MHTFAFVSYSYFSDHHPSASLFLYHKNTQVLLDCSQWKRALRTVHAFKKCSGEIVPDTPLRYPPFPLSFFEHIDCPLRGGEVPPCPLRKKSAKKTAIFGQKALILALFDPFFRNFFGDCPLRGGGVPPPFR